MPEWMPRRAIIAPASEDERAAVRRVQRVLRLDETGEMDDATKAALRGIQAQFRLPVTGVLDVATAEQVERLQWVPPGEGKREAR